MWVFELVVMYNVHTYVHDGMEDIVCQSFVWRLKQALSTAS